MPVGTLVLPNPSDVRYGVQYGANGTEFTGTLYPPFVPPAGPIATQGYTIQQILTAFESYLQVVTQLEARYIVLWNFSGRPSIEGRDNLVWYRPFSSPIDKSTGPVRFGNKIDCIMEVNLNTRSFADGSQRDIRRFALHYDLVFKLLSAFQGLSLFPLTVVTAPISGTWMPPSPAAPNIPPISVEPMLVDILPPIDKDQYEEGTLTTRLKVTIPCVLALTIASYQ